jgi:cytochrome P450
MSDLSATIPNHIPRELIGEYPLVRGRTSTERPHDLIQRLQDEETRSGWYVPGLFADSGGWVFRSMADNSLIGPNVEHFSNTASAPFGALTGGTWRAVPNDYDPPEHSWYRRVLNPAFTPREMAKLEVKIRAHAHKYVSEFREQRSCEFMRDFAYKFPINIFLEFMGLPQERASEFLGWERGLIHGESLQEMKDCALQVVEYMEGEIGDHRARPREDLISYAANAEVSGRRLDESEMLGLCFLLFLGGLDSVTTHLGFFFRHLAEHPEHQAALRAEPTLIDPAVEELMRAYASITSQKLCIKDIEIAGIQIRVGDSVAVSGPLAGRDRGAFPDADVVRFDRKPRTISFGYGPHMCLGIHLARRELRIAMETMLGELPEFSLAPGVVIESRLGAIPHPMQVPLVW